MKKKQTNKKKKKKNKTKKTNKQKNKKQTNKQSQLVLKSFIMEGPDSLESVAYDNK